MCGYQKKGTNKMNELRFEGRIEKITVKNDKVIKFTLVNKKNKKITGTVFNNKTSKYIYDQIEENVGQVVTITAEMSDTSYQDKKTNLWVNSYCACINKMEVQEELPF